MKRHRAVHTLIALAFALVTNSNAAAELTGDEAPDFALKSVAGENLRLSEYRGRIVMLSFWASWCGDCRAQLAGLAEMYDRYSGGGFELLAVSLDTNLKQAADTAESMRAAYPVLHDVGGEVGRLYEVDRTPFIVLIDREGLVREVIEGYRRGDEEQYLERVRALLSE
jgi:peroxiredoxin